MDLLMIFKISIFSLIESLTEFIPVSSTAHLVFISQFINLDLGFVQSVFEICIQAGAFFALSAIMIPYVWRHPRFFPLGIVGFIPTGIGGFLVYPYVKSALGGSELIFIVSILIGGAVILIFEDFIWVKTEIIRKKYYKRKNEYNISYKQAFSIGCFQMLSFIPGISRALTTIYGGRIVGLSKDEAFTFSFILAIPTILSASGYSLYKEWGVVTQNHLWIIGLGTLLSTIFSFIIIKILLKYIKKMHWDYFGWYRIALGTIWYLFFFL